MENNMENIVNALTQINNKAEKILADAGSCKVNMQKQFTNDIKEYEDELNKKTELELKKVEADNNRAFEDKKNSIYKEAETNIKSMEDNYKKNHDALVEDLFNKVISFEV